MNAPAQLLGQHHAALMAARVRTGKFLALSVEGGRFQIEAITCAPNGEAAVVVLVSDLGAAEVAPQLDAL